LSRAFFFSTLRAIFVIAVVALHCLLQAPYQHINQSNNPKNIQNQQLVIKTKEATNPIEPKSHQI